MTRMTSLNKDRNDENALSWGRYKNMGACVAGEYYQHNPFFFTREGAEVGLIGQYRGASAFIVASGPSFKDVDKHKVAQAGVWAMTLNNAVASFRGNAACIVDDPCRFTFSLWLDPKIQKFVPKSAFGKPLWDNRLLTLPDGTKRQMWQPAQVKVGDCPNVIGYRRNEKFIASRFLYEDTINWGCHKKWGGGRSVLLAAMRITFLLGFRKVYLFGVDFEMSEDKKYHFNEERTPGAIRGNMSTYAKMKQWFAELQPHLLAENFVVKNCNPDSQLDAFPKMTADEAIAEATGSLGDVNAERTMGMYATYEEKFAPWQTEQVRTLNPSFAPKPVAQPPRIAGGVPQGVIAQFGVAPPSSLHAAPNEPNQNADQPTGESPQAMDSP